MAEAQTKVAVKAKMKIDSKPADIVANFGDGFTLFLTERAKLGTPISFCQWAKKAFNAEIPLIDGLTLPDVRDDQPAAVKKHLNDKLGIPSALQETLSRLLLVEIYLDDLVVDTKNSAFMFGMTLDFKGKGNEGWELLPNCELEEFQLLITRKTEEYKFPERPKLPDVPPLLEEPAEIDEAEGENDSPPPPRQPKKRVARS
jgi:hypothetical protein